MHFEHLDSSTFSPFGTLLALDINGENPVFQIPVETESSGWRIAILKVLPKTLDQLEAHPNSKESFEPMSGWAVLVVATRENPQDIHGFLLDRPVCLHPGIWHGIITLTESSLCKITENLHVDMEYLPLGYTLTPTLAANPSSD